MKAFLLAAGEGRRLRPLTDTLPKCLVPIDGTPLLGIWLDLLERHGVSEVLVNLHHHAARVEAYIAARAGHPRVTVAHEPALLGSAGTVLANWSFVEGEPRFFVVYADVLTRSNLTGMRQFHDAGPTTLTMGVVPTDRPREKGTVVLDSAARVVAFEEKAAEPRSNLANAGIYVATGKLVDYLRAADPHTRPFDFGYHVLPRMVPDVRAYRIEEFLTDIGSPESYAHAVASWPAVAATPAPGR